MSHGLNNFRGTEMGAPKWGRQINRCGHFDAAPYALTRPRLPVNLEIMKHHPPRPSRVLTLPGLREGVAKYGATGFAARVGVKVQALYRWQAVGQVPAARARQVEAITGVTAMQMRPDIFGEVGEAA